MPPTIDIAGDRLSVHFTEFNADAYPLFLRVKALPEFDIQYVGPSESYQITAPARFASMLGVEPPQHNGSALPLLNKLFDDQQTIVRTILDAKRFAYWGDCGLGKTVVGLEVARQIVHRTGGRVLIFTLNDIVPGWIEEAENFYGDSLPVLRLNSREEMRAFAAGTLDADCRIAITNYEKMNYAHDGEQIVNELRHLAGVVLDESDRLKAGGGKQKWALIKSCRGIEYKLSLTATPAPNDTIEYASQASFLEKMRSDNEIIWTFFQRDEKTQRWTVKRHARKAFFEFMAGWSIYVRDPRRYGWRQNFPDVPPPRVIRHDIDLTDEQQLAMRRYTTAADGQQSLFDSDDRNAIQRGKLAQIARGFVYVKGEASKSFQRIESHKPEFVARLVRNHVAAGRQTLVWTTYDAESQLVCEQLTRLGVEFDSLHGTTPPAMRQAIKDNFRRGRLPCLVTKASLLGYGQNFQNCKAMVFSGFNDSYVQFYQAIRRAVRYGQRDEVIVDMPVVPELEGDMIENLLIKQAKHEGDMREMEEQFVAAHQRLKGAA